MRTTIALLAGLVITLPAIGPATESEQDPLREFYSKAAFARLVCSLEITNGLLELRLGRRSRASVVEAASDCVSKRRSEAEAVLPPALAAWEVRGGSGEEFDPFLAEWRRQLGALAPLPTELSSKNGSDMYERRLEGDARALLKKWEELVPPPEPPPRPSPFGLAKGLTRASVEQQVGKLEEIGTFTYSADKVPRPHPAFESYVLVITPESGLCQIRAVGKTITTSVFGAQLLEQHLELLKQLSDNYGGFESADMDVTRGSLWSEPEDFMMSLLQKDRVIQTVWHSKYGSRLQNDIEEIILGARALNQTEGYLLLQYSYSNRGECEAAISKAESNVL